MAMRRATKTKSSLKGRKVSNIVNGLRRKVDSEIDALKKSGRRSLRKMVSTGKSTRTGAIRARKKSVRARARASA
jgi:hypothetical protein